MRRTAFGLLLLVVVLAGSALPAAAGETDNRLNGAYRNPVQAGWIFVHLEGSPADIGYQHGALLAPEIEDSKRAIELSVTHEVTHNWSELRTLSEKYFWPAVPQEYRDEIEGMVEGLRTTGSKLDALDLTTMNAYMGSEERRVGKECRL